MNTTEAKAEPVILVWDLPLRLCHWALVLCVSGSWLTHELGMAWFSWHRWLGYSALVLVMFRIAWGFVGPRHARFASFLRGPLAIVAELRRLPGTAVTAAVGHSPLGAVSVLLLLLLLLLQAVTGLFANDEILSTGPLYGYVSDTQSDQLTRLHKGSFNVLLGVIVLHVLAIAYYRLRKRLDLLTPMWTGRKPLAAFPDAVSIRSQRLWLAIVLVLLAAAALAWVLDRAPEASMSLF